MARRSRWSQGIRHAIHRSTVEGSEMAITDARTQGNQTPLGVMAVYVYDGRVIASASDFNRFTPGGCTMAEAQTYRVRNALAWEVVRALASPALYENLSAYDCQQIVQKMKGREQIIPISHADPEVQP